MSKPKRSRSRKILVGVAIIGAMALIGGRLAVSLHRITSGSMLPTIEADGRLVAAVRFVTPELGDVIVFDYPENPQAQFMKRIVAKGGQVVEVHGQLTIVDGKPLPRCEVGDSHHPDATGKLFLERAGERSYLVVITDASDIGAPCKADADCGPRQSCRFDRCGYLSGPFTVPEGEFFVLGDNRRNAHDSRSWNGGLGGTVPADTVRGVVMNKPVRLPTGDEHLSSALTACRKKLGE